MTVVRRINWNLDSAWRDRDHKNGKNSMTISPLPAVLVCLRWYFKTCVYIYIIIALFSNSDACKNRLLQVFIVFRPAGGASHSLLYLWMTSRQTRASGRHRAGLHCQWRGHMCPLICLTSNTTITTTTTATNDNDNPVELIWPLLILSKPITIKTGSILLRNGAFFAWLYLKQ